MLIALFAAAFARPLPTPYTADQICAAMPVGSTIDLRATRPPDAPVALRWTVTAATPTDVTLATSLGADGPVVSTDTHACADLRLHASFERGVARRARAALTTPWGPMRGWRYVVQEPDGGVTTYEFADAIPGPPVRMWTTMGGATVDQLEQVARAPAPSR